MLSGKPEKSLINTTLIQTKAMAFSITWVQSWTPPSNSQSMRVTIGVKLTEGLVSHGKVCIGRSFFNSIKETIYIIKRENSTIPQVLRMWRPYKHQVILLQQKSWKMN